MLQTSQERPRIIVTTDGEIDDRCSFNRFLLYTCDFDIAGLIYVNSCWHKHGEGTTWMEEAIEKYAQVHENLLLHNPDYPSPHDLLSVIAIGDLENYAMEGLGEGKSTAGSNLIASALMDDDPRPLWIEAWGGTNTIAQALYDIRALHPEKLEWAIAKFRCHAISIQEEPESNDSVNWIVREFPDAVMLKNHFFFISIGYAADRIKGRPNGKNPHGNADFFFEPWLNEHIKKGHGPLGASYPNTEVTEGDSPSYFHVIKTGLRSLENLSWGGWGGRFHNERGNFWWDENPAAWDDNDIAKSQWRWLPAVFADWKARMDWCVMNYKEANHHPVVLLSHPEDLTVAPGATVNLNAEGTTDPDGDALSYHWWQYCEPGTYDGKVSIDNCNSAQACFVAPDAIGKTIHIILEVTDNGHAPLTRYRRVVVTVV